MQFIYIYITGNMFPHYIHVCRLELHQTPKQDVNPVTSCTKLDLVTKYMWEHILVTARGLRLIIVCIYSATDSHTIIRKPFVVQGVAEGWRATREWVDPSGGIAIDVLERDLGPAKVWATDVSRCALEAAPHAHPAAALVHQEDGPNVLTYSSLLGCSF